MSRTSSQSEWCENEFENALHPAHLPLSRTPLNSIPDPSQYHKETLESGGDDKLQRFSQLLEKKVQALRAGFNYSTPKISNRGGKLNSEPSSTQSTPARGGSRMSLGGIAGVCTGPRGRESIGGRGVNVSSRVSRGIQIVNSDVSVLSPHFELEEDASFWNDHNVQVLIRIRPLSNMEKVTRGYGRCLKQETGERLVWLGHPETRFTFDHVACETISQEKLFRVAGLPMVENCLSGYNSCMFAYGQTGSGKTYTMMGEITEVDGKFSKDCGITPRVFEYLFTRIRAEEDCRRDEKLTYSCKCSFLEIYNEQITDLLEPSSSNLQLREDMTKEVYVENLTEYEVRTVGDVVKLLLHGAANRKIAATDMNSESSRSHSVFTCIIESRWEKDSMNHFRFARLNLVDLAGSERQKSSGAEGGRLKEAANINKSLSTLGLVIMSLVDLAHGKQRHIPYRDSRLTFLLQDSLGGNSKTTIIANVSPSLCSGSETLSTLKFAQRAKLIQNNAKVNEDASGDVNALQKQIQLLKHQLSSLMEHQIPPRSSLESGRGVEASCSSSSNEHDCPGEKSSSVLHIHNEKTLVGALRRERITEIEMQKLKAEIDQMSCLVRQRESDAQRSCMILKLREEKIKRLEMLLDGKTSADKYLLEENKALLEEIHLLQDKIKNNPKLTEIALKHDKLLKKLQTYETFYAQGEREALLAEISDLRNQLLKALEGNPTSKEEVANQDEEDLVETRKMNCKLMREVEELQTEMEKRLRCSQASYTSDADPSLKYHQESSKDGKCSFMETLSLRSESEDEEASYAATDDESLQTRIRRSGEKSSDTKNIDIQKELRDARIIIEALEADQVQLLNELQQVQEENSRLMARLENADNGESSSLVVSETQIGQTDPIQAKLDRIMRELEDVTSHNNRYREERASHLSQEKEVDLVREQVELETARTILQLQEDVAVVKLEFGEKLTVINQENSRLRDIVAAKQDEIVACNTNWENAILELTKFLVDGSRSIKDASKNIATISGSFPQVNTLINDHVEKAAIACIEKEKTILVLQKSLEDAQKTVIEMEQKIGSLKGATIALSEIEHFSDDGNAKAAVDLSRKLQEKTTAIGMLERLLKHTENQRAEAAKHVFAALLVTKWALNCHGRGVVLKKDADTERDNSPKVTHLIGQQFQDFSDRKGNGDFQIVEKADQANSEDEGCGLGTPPQRQFNSEEKADNKFRNADIFLTKFEEASATMKEADSMLNELIKANEEAKSLTDIWKQAGEALIAERTSLIEEVEQLKYSLDLKEGENEQLMDSLRHTFVETESSLSLLEQCFRQMQTDVDHMFMSMQADVLSVKQDILGFLRNSRSSVEDFSREIMEKSFMLFVLFQGHIDHLVQNLPFSSKWSNDPLKQPKQRPAALDVHAEGASNSMEGFMQTEPSNIVKKFYTTDVDIDEDSSMGDNFSVRKELERKDILLKGLLFDFRLLQESASNTKMKLDKAEESLLHACEVQHELDLKTSQLEDMVVQQRNLELRLAENENDLSVSLSDLELSNKTIEILSDQNAELRTLLKDVYLKKSELEEQVDEQKEVIKSLEEEIHHLTTSMEKKVHSSVENKQEELKSVVTERDQLLEEVRSLNEKIQIVSSLADENEAIALEARQESEASKIYAEQKEEEVKILESSIQELEYTVDVLEKQVNEMDHDVDRQRLIRESLELELQALRERLLTVEDFTDATCGDNVKKCDLNELIEAHRRIKFLELERIEHEREIKQCKEYISELVLHAEAQASQYQQKYKVLESMVHEVQNDKSSSGFVAPPMDKNERSVVRARGSSSPFRCISSLIQQTNMEKEQELSVAKIRVQELETLAASQQKEVCMLSTRLAATESMTHDVIRDLLGVKLDITNYANFIEENQVQKLVETAFRLKEDLCAKEEEVLQLMKEIEELIEDRESCIAELKKKEADTLATHINLEQLQQRNQLLSAQNEMLKNDKSNLKRRVIELDDMVKTLLGTQSAQKPPQHTLRSKENRFSRVDPSDLNKKLAQSEKLLSRVNNELAHFRGASSSNLQERTSSRHSLDTVKRKPRV